MRNLLRFLGITALVAVIGFAMASCGDGGGGGGGGGNPSGGGKTLVITGITDTQKDNEGAYGFTVGLFTPGTSDNDAKNRVVLPVAYGEYYDNPKGSSNNWTVTVPLYTTGSTTTRWNGSGNYIVGFELYSDEDTFVYYKKNNVPFTKATTTIPATDFTKVQ